MLRRLAVHLVALAVFAVSLVGIAQSGTLAAQTALGAEPIGWVLESSGIVHELGGAPDLGDAPTVASPAVALTATIDGNGFWVLLSNGEISAHGTAIHHGDLSDIALDRPAIALSATPSGNGYIVLAQDGGVFSFGDAGFFGSVPAVAPDAAINTTAVAIQISEYGYRIIHDDGGVFAFGDAHFAGSIPGVLQGRPLDRPITAAVEGPSERAYAMMGGDGGVFAFGMTFQGSMAGIAGIEIVAASNDRSDGYVLLD
ncbi:MAG: hypothetical protein GY925_19380, partial [Actinomycetia bacterium]|nr:hypothetical protein [Actinomycetes bacterium]